MYAHADWLRDPARLRSNGNFVLRCGSPAQGAELFEITGGLPSLKTE